MGLTALDMVVLLLIGAGMLLGWLRGFVSEVLSLLAWFLAIVALRYLYGPVYSLLERPVGTGASVLTFALIFGLVFVGGKLASRRLGSRVRQSVVGPLDRVLGAGFGGLKGLIGATLLFLGINLIYDTIWGRASLRPDWMAHSRTYALLKSSGATVVDLLDAERSPTAASNQVQPANSQ